MIIYWLALMAAGYQVVAQIACLCFRGQKPSPKQAAVSVSILKPVAGLDDGFREALASHAALEGDCEILCGVRNPQDPALPVIREFPSIRVVEVTTPTQNGKVGALIDMARAARHPILIVNDADIRVDPDYAQRVTAPLSDPGIGLVTCLYRPIGSTFAARFEGLGVSTDFAPSALVARLFGVNEFAFGSTMAFRRTDLERIGGFEAISDYLADDYQLGRRIHALGLKCLVSDMIVSTHLDGGWGDVWRHQVRWARTIRVSNFWGYLGLPVTFATVWALAAALDGQVKLAVALLAARILMAIESGWFVLKSPDVLRLWFLIPLRDLFGTAVWMAGLFGNSVLWRGQRLQLDSSGRVRTGQGR